MVRIEKKQSDQMKERIKNEKRYRFHCFLKPLRIG